MFIFTLSFGWSYQTLILSGKDVYMGPHPQTEYNISVLIYFIVMCQPDQLFKKQQQSKLFNFIYNFISDAPASAAYFASYELIQRWLQGPNR